jgi:hypothetical protein
MEELDILRKLDRVRAPEGFERLVHEKIAARSGKKVRLRPALKFALAGAAALAVVGAVLIAVFLPGGRPSGLVAGRGPGERPAEEALVDRAGRVVRSASTMPLLEIIDYSGEVGTASFEPRTVYILEQVPEVRPLPVKY